MSNVDWCIRSPADKGNVLTLNNTDSVCHNSLSLCAHVFIQEMSNGLKVTRSIASTSRKAFWLLKSFNHVEAVIHLIETYEHSTDECYADLMDILEQLFLILYYIYENLVFVARTKLVSFQDDAFDEWGDVTWFLEDFAGFIAALLRSYIAAKRVRLKEQMLQLCDERLAQDGQDVHIFYKSAAPVETAVPMNVLKELEELKTRYSDSLLTVAIVSRLICRCCS